MSERVLIVDDDPSFRRVVDYTLTEAGYETTDNPSLRTSNDAPYDGHPTMAGVTVTQLLVDGGQRSGRNQRASVNRELSEIAQQSAMQQWLASALRAPLCSS